MSIQNSIHCNAELAAVKALAEQALGSGVQTAGETGYVGCMNGRVVKFRTHWLREELFGDAVNPLERQACDHARQLIASLTHSLYKDCVTDEMAEILRKMSLKCNPGTQDKIKLDG